MEVLSVAGSTAGGCASLVDPQASEQGANPRWEGTLLENTATSTPPVACARPALPADKVGIKPEISNSPLNRVLSWTLFDDKS